MRNRDDGDARLAFRREQQRLRIQRITARPRGKTGRGQQAVDGQGQRLPVFGRVKGLQVQCAQLLHGRPLHGIDEPRQVQVATGLPRLRHQGRQQNVLAALQRVALDTQQRQQTRHQAGDALGQRGRVGPLRLGGRGERAQHRQRQSGVRSRGVDGHVHCGAQRADALGRLVPVRQPLAPLPGHLLGISRHVQALAGRLAGVYPWRKVSCGQLRKIEQQVSQIALGVYAQGRHAIDSGLFQQRQTQSGLTAAGHAHANRMGGQVARVVQQGLRRRLPGAGVILAAQIERAQFLVVAAHACRPPLKSPKAT